MTRPYMSAPGAGQVRDGLNPRVLLWGFQRVPSFSLYGFPSFTVINKNPIQQSADFSRRTILNTTLNGHQFHPGQVAIEVLDGPGGGSIIDIHGSGSGERPGLNNAIGYSFFGAAALTVAFQCSSAIAQPIQ